MRGRKQTTAVGDARGEAVGGALSEHFTETAQLGGGCQDADAWS
jgi:hypothetical protein